MTRITDIERKGDDPDHRHREETATTRIIDIERKRR